MVAEKIADQGGGEMKYGMGWEGQVKARQGKSRGYDVDDRDKPQTAGAANEYSGATRYR